MIWRSNDHIDVDVDVEMSSRVEAEPRSCPGYIAVRRVSKGDKYRINSRDHIPDGLFTPKDIEWLLRKGAIKER